MEQFRLIVCLPQIVVARLGQNRSDSLFLEEDEYEESNEESSQEESEEEDVFENASEEEEGVGDIDNNSIIGASENEIDNLIMQEQVAEEVSRVSSDEMEGTGIHQSIISSSVEAIQRIPTSNEQLQNLERIDDSVETLTQIASTNEGATNHPFAITSSVERHSTTISSSSNHESTLHDGDDGAAFTHRRKVQAMSLSSLDTDHESDEDHSVIVTC